MDYKEYSRLRSIAQKRVKRAVEKGLISELRFPTVKELRSGVVNVEDAFRGIKRFYEGGTTITEIKAKGFKPEVFSYENLVKEPAKPKRRSFSKQADYLRSHAESTEQGVSHVAYLKAVRTLINKFKSHGRDLGLNLNEMSNKQLQDLAEYLDYRFSQSDFKKKYVIEGFVTDYVAGKEKGYTGKQLREDFDRFLVDRDLVRKDTGKAKKMSATKWLKMYKEYTDNMSLLGVFLQ